MKRIFERKVLELANKKIKVNLYLPNSILNKYTFGDMHSMYIRTCFNHSNNYQLFVFKSNDRINPIKIVNKASASSVYRIAEEFGVNLTKEL